jgi:hypothetical protein
VRKNGISTAAALTPPILKLLLRMTSKSPILYTKLLWFFHPRGSWSDTRRCSDGWQAPAPGQKRKGKNCPNHVALPESILNKLADTLEASQQSLQTQGELFKNILNAFISIQSQTSDIQARLTLLEKYSKDTSLHSNK